MRSNIPARSLGPMSFKTKNSVPILLKAIRVIELIAQGQAETSSRALAKELKLPQSTCYRILQSFASRDWLRQMPGGGFRIAYGVMPLLEAFSNHELLIQTVRDPLNTLARETGLTVKMSIQQGPNAVTIFCTESLAATSVRVRLGSKFCLTLGSSGAVFLSQMGKDLVESVIQSAPPESWQNQKLSDVRARIKSIKSQGYAIDMGTYQKQLCAMSAPLTTGTGKVLAAVTIIGFKHDFAGRRAQIKEKLLFTAGGCNRLLAGLGFEIV